MLEHRTGRDRVDSLIIKPLFDGGGTGRGTTLNICDTTRIQGHPKEGIGL